MVKICAIGDPHGDLGKIRKVARDVDFYLVTGDLGKVDLARKIHFDNLEREKKGLPEKEIGIKEKKSIHDEIHFSTLGVLKTLSRHAPVYSLQGNVGITTFAEARKRSEEDGFENLATRKIIDDDARTHIVKNVVRRIGGLRIGFLEYFVDECWVREFKPGDYKKKLASARKASEKVKGILKRFGKVDILVCHQPPFGYLDKVTWKEAPKSYRGKHAGSKVILDYVKKFQPRYVFCGHIHEGEGKVRIGESEVFNLGVGGSVCVEIRKN